VVALSASELTRRALTGAPVALVGTSAAQSVMAPGPVTVKAMRVPSGDHIGCPMRPAVAGTVMARIAVPPPSGCSASPVYETSREPPLVRGLSRSPASRSSGAPTSSMEGSPRRRRWRSHFRSGLTLTAGSGSASSAWAMGCGGC
jgi:hypothetical protein